MKEEKMLAVRLPSEIVGDVKKYAAAVKAPIKRVVEDLIQLGISQNFLEVSGINPLSGTADKHELFAHFREAQRRREVVPWAEKKMLAVRISPGLKETLNNYAISYQRNISFIVEVFIYIGLAQKKGVRIDTKAFVDLKRTPFRQRWKNVQR